MTGSNWTGRTPRNVQQAFGTYTSREVAPMPHKASRGERVAGALFAVTLGIVGCAILVTWWAR